MSDYSPEGRPTGLRCPRCRRGEIHLSFARVFDAGYTGCWALVCRNPTEAPCLHRAITAAQVDAMEAAIDSGTGAALALKILRKA